MECHHPIQYAHEQRGHLLDARVHRAGPPDDPGAGLFLRRDGALEERPEHDDDEFRRAGPGGRGVGAARLLAGVRAGHSDDRIAGVCRPERRRARGARDDPASVVHGVSGHVRHHHRGADLRRGRRTLPLSRVSRIHRGVGPARLRAGCALGLGRRLPRRAWRARLCRRRGSARERRGGGAGRGDRRRSAQGLRTARHPAAQRAVHDARRRPAVVRLVRLQRRQRAGRRTDWRARVRQHACWRRRRRWRRGR